MAVRQHAVALSLILAAATAVPVAAQVQQQSATAARLAPANQRGAAIVELQAAVDDQLAWSFTTAAEHAQRALDLDPQFGLARAWLARLRGGPAAAAEFDRAASDAATASLPEAVLVEAMREENAGRIQNAAKLFALATELTPGDPRVAVDRATSLLGEERIRALREAAARFPDYAPARFWLAFFLTADGFGQFSPATADEALNAARDAMRLAPGSAAGHTIMGHVLERLLRHEEALQHLDEATAMSPTNEWAYALKAEIAIREGMYARARATFDSALALSPNSARRTGYRISRAVTFLHEGKLSQAVDSLAAFAREAEAGGMTDVAATAHLNMALLAAAVHDAGGVDAHLAAAQRLGSSAGLLVDNRVISFALLGDGVRARRALEEYVRFTHSVPADVRDPNVHRMTGLTLLAEKKPAEAIAELKQGGSNPYAQLGLIEAYKMMGDRKSADAERAALFARKNIPYGSTAIPIAKYRASMKG